MSEPRISKLERVRNIARHFAHALEDLDDSKLAVMRKHAVEFAAQLNDIWAAEFKKIYPDYKTKEEESEEQFKKVEEARLKQEERTKQLQKEQAQHQPDPNAA